MGKVIDIQAPENIVSGKVVDTAYFFHKELGAGLLESAYELALVHMLKRHHDFKVERQKTLPVEIDGLKIEAGFRPDLIIEDQVIVELKAVEKLIPLHKAQLITYLKLSGVKVGLLINFNETYFKNAVQRIVV
ncbi:MAG: GxxExxY protein [Alphaproteobacteria bacterium]